MEHIRRLALDAATGRGICVTVPQSEVDEAVKLAALCGVDISKCPRRATPIGEPPRRELIISKPVGRAAQKFKIKL